MAAVCFFETGSSSGPLTEFSFW